MMMMMMMQHCSWEAVIRVLVARTDLQVSVAHMTTICIVH